MDASDAGDLKSLLPMLTTFELVDLLDAINEELRDREVEVESYSAMGEQGAIDWEEYEAMWGRDED